MINSLRRNYKTGDYVYVVDYWGSEHGMQAFEAGAKIVYVDEAKKIFEAVLYGDTYHVYSFKDYGRLIFDTRKEAIETAAKLPKPGTTIYQKIGKRVYKKLIIGIYGQYFNGTFDLVLHFNKGETVSIKEIGHSVFVNESDARR